MKKVFLRAVKELSIFLAIHPKGNVKEAGRVNILGGENVVNGRPILKVGKLWQERWGCGGEKVGIWKDGKFVQFFLR